MAHGTIVKVFGWYDNEWGYSCRLVDLMTQTAALTTVSAVAVRLPRSVREADVAGKHVSSVPT